MWFAVCWLLVVAMASAQDARSLLEQAERALSGADGIQAYFTVRAVDESAEGTICLRGEKFVLQAEGVKTWFDGKTQWSYLTSSDEVNISEPTAEELQAIQPYAWLSLYKQGYQLKMGQATHFQGTPIQEVVMTGTQRQDLLCIVLYLDKQSHLPLRISMAQRGGAVTVVTIRSYHVGQQWPDSFFTFDSSQYPDAELIDLR